MEVILLERIEKLGLMGQTVKVRPGFARNYLLPQKKALRATKANLEAFEKQREALEAKNATLRTEAEKTAQTIDGAKVVVIRQASETGMLYGSVSARDVAEVAKEAGFPIERLMVQIDQPIKMLGLFPVKIKLHPEVAIKLTVNVARSPEEAVLQAEKGEALIRQAEVAATAEAEKAMVEAIGPSEAESEPPAADETTKKAKKTRAKKTAKAEEVEE
ncbi:MAG: 50S ribosomal protein L9 [Alphaproteobacteria bacterium]|nr:50S ribosomal protein L9 [Alphaproteobacteria bacterium]